MQDVSFRKGFALVDSPKERCLVEEFAPALLAHIKDLAANGLILGTPTPRRALADYILQANEVFD
jgi:hypothetical protein